MFRFDYTPYEKSLWGDPSLGLICNHRGCSHEGEAAPESDDADRRDRKGYSIGYMFVWVLPIALVVIFGCFLAGILLSWWQFALITAGAVLFVALLACWGLYAGNDFRSRTHRTYICPVCRRDSLIPLNSPRGQMLHARNQEGAVE